MEHLIWDYETPNMYIRNTIMGYMEHLISDIWEYGTPNMGL